MSTEVRCVHCRYVLAGDALETAVDGACADQWRCVFRQVRVRGVRSVPEVDELLDANAALAALCRRWDAQDDAIRRARREGAR